jgi:hypothetical protein
MIRNREEPTMPKTKAEQTLAIELRAPHYGGPVIVLVNTIAMSTVEGLPLAIQ